MISCMLHVLQISDILSEFFFFNNAVAKMWDVQVFRFERFYFITTLYDLVTIILTYVIQKRKILSFRNNSFFLLKRLIPSAQNFFTIQVFHPSTIQSLSNTIFTKKGKWSVKKIKKNSWNYNCDKVTIIYCFYWGR